MSEQDNGHLSREKLAEFFKEEHIAPILERYSTKQIGFIMSRLTADERQAVRDPDDYLTAAVVSHMPVERWKVYEERYEIVDPLHLISAQMQWLKDKKDYLEQELGREPTQNEFGERIGDVEHVGLRNRVLYIFKYMNDKSKIRPKNVSLSA
ncbi:MAG: hypothetical protein AABX85_04885 [Nanoarchaeota archaeon]